MRAIVIVFSLLSVGWLAPLCFALNCLITWVQNEYTVAHDEHSFPYLSAARDALTVAGVWLGIAVLFWSLFLGWTCFVKSGKLATLMKRRPRTVVALFALAMLGVLAWLRFGSAGRLSYAEVRGRQWDEKTKSSIWVVIRVDDPQVLAQVQPWRDALRQEAREASLKRLARWLRGRQHSENAMRQPIDCLALVYENGHQEILAVNVYQTPFATSYKKLVRKELDD